MSNRKFVELDTLDPNDETDTRNYIVNREKEPTNWLVVLAVIAFHAIPIILIFNGYHTFAGVIFIVSLISILKGKEILRWVREKLNKINLD